MKTGQKGFAPIGVIIIMLTLLALGVIVYYFETVKNSASRQTIDTFSAVPDWPEQALMNDAVYDASGAHLASFDNFTLVHQDDNDFYKIRAGLFEGVLGYRHHLTREGGAVDFVLAANGVPWTDPLFNSENYARKVELGNMLKTVRLNT